MSYVRFFRMHKKIALITKLDRNNMVTSEYHTSVPLNWLQLYYNFMTSNVKLAHAVAVLSIAEELNILLPFFFVFIETDRASQRKKN